MQDHQSNARHLRRNMTWQERTLWSILRNRSLHGYKFRRQMVIGNYIVDFVCLEKRLVVELDGRGHANQQAYDESRTEWLCAQDFRVVRFWNTEMEDNVTVVTQTILARLRETNPSPPTPLPQGEKGEDC